jgi:hypothetical protein
MALAPINPTNLTPPRVEFIDPRSGAISREWYRFFLSLLNATETNQSEVELSPDTASLLATYDAMLETLTQTTEIQPDCCATGQAVIASDIQALSLTPTAVELSALAVVQSDIQALSLAPSDPGGSVTSVAASGGTTGLTFTGSPITSSGTLTLGGTLAIANGGTGATTLTSGYLVKGNGTSAVSASLVYDTGTNIGIGTTTPDQKLTVDGSVKAGLGTSQSVLGLKEILFYNTSISEALVKSADDSSTFDSIGISKDVVRFLTQNAERVRIDGSGNVGVGATANASAILDVQSTTKGFRLPNMTTVQKNAISSPAAGLMVFDTTLSKACVYSGAAWQTITSI